MCRGKAGSLACTGVASCRPKTQECLHHTRCAREPQLSRHPQQLARNCRTGGCCGFACPARATAGRASSHTSGSSAYMTGTEARALRTVNPVPAGASSVDSWTVTWPETSGKGTAMLSICTAIIVGTQERSPGAGRSGGELTHPNRDVRPAQFDRGSTGTFLSQPREAVLQVVPSVIKLVDTATTHIR